MDTITTIQDLLMCNGSAQPVTVVLTQNETRLIAAAPEMLIALEHIAGTTLDENARAMALEAIKRAKAEGTKGEAQ